MVKHKSELTQVRHWTGGISFGLSMYFSAVAHRMWVILGHIRIRRLLWPLAIRVAYPAGLPGGSTRVIRADGADGFRLTAKKTSKILLNNLR
ncbi:MAG: hypothetical protein CVV41_10660 [Candidatus Riflebacteria bacterium HGW-Riflebacteria-1]|jgi:hypothetical protein|nr:MAG: hypothetical protein CVV41_10660 [Candidatus Riflebacteria bacterium HGW-Riflebacteria-1]